MGKIVQFRHLDRDGEYEPFRKGFREHQSRTLQAQDLLHMGQRQQDM